MLKDKNARINNIRSLFLFFFVSAACVRLPCLPRTRERRVAPRLGDKKGIKGTDTYKKYTRMAQSCLCFDVGATLNGKT